MATEDHIKHLLARYQSDKYTKAEYEELLDYFGIEGNEAEAEQLLYEAIQSDEVRMEVSQDRMEQVMERAGKRLQQRINGRRSPTLIRKILAYAAAVFLILSFSLYFYNNKMSQQADTLTSIYGDDVLPGGNHAYITLSDGRRIALDSSRNTLTATVDGLAYADGEQIVAGNSVEYATISTPTGGSYQMVLPDGTRAWLNAASSLKYPLYFASKDRTVAIEGEVYLEVATDQSKPFVIESDGQHIEVLGTALNIRNYEQRSITTLVHGKIALTNNGTKERITMRPGDQALLTDGKMRVAKVDPTYYSMWKDGIILNKDATLQETCHELARWYGVNFIFPSGFNNDELALNSINRNEKLSSVLAALANTYQVNFEIRGKEVYIIR